MEVKTKKAFESGKLYGVYRCGKREKLLRKIPQIEKLDMPDATGIIISGIMNFGNDSDTIRAMAKDAIGCDAEDIKIPYDEIGSISSVSEDVSETVIIENGSFVLAGCEELNKPFLK